jgi:phosphate transport system substrate-binding protein
MKKILILIPAIALLLSSCGGDKTNDTKNGAAVKELTGAGATFPNTLYQKMFSEYNKKTGIQVNYGSIGSGGGIAKLKDKIVDFGASDAFLSDDDIKTIPAEVIHIPTCLGAVVITYNLPGSPKLKMTPEIVGGIFAGKIKKWNDPKITAENAGVNLPDKDIKVVHRSDGSGTTSIFTDYLVKVSPDFVSVVPKAGKEVKWPEGEVGAKGNEGVASSVKGAEGSIGYVELIYAQQTNMPMADIKNAAGKYVTPSLASTAASANIDNMPADTRIMLDNSPAADAYPITSFTWLLIYKEQKYGNRTEEQAKALVNLLWWMIHEGQQYNEALSFGKLSEKAVTAAEANLKAVTYNGKTVYSANPQ